MNNLLNLTAEQILSIPVDNPEHIFSINEFKSQKMKIRSKWAPDRNRHTKATQVFQHLQKMFKVAETKIENNEWGGNSTILFTAYSGKQYELKYYKMHKFELGKMYIAKETIMYVVDEKYGDLFKNAIKRMDGIKYIDGRIANEFQRLMPELKLHTKADIGFVLVIKKPPGAILMQDFIDHIQNNKIPPRHVAWIVNSLYNISVFFEMQGLCHNALMSTTLFIDPQNHAIFPLGGWWYSSVEGDRLKSIPSKLVPILPPTIFKEKKSHTEYDRDAIKALAIQCLGDDTLVGSKLLSDKDIPNRITNWLRMPSIGTALMEYKEWEDILFKSFGKRKFIKCNLTFDHIYKEVS